MALAETEITADAAYAVRFERGLSAKRFRDAVALVKGIDGQRNEYVYDPENPAASNVGYVRNDDPASATANFDAASKTWTVTIPAAGGRALSDLQTAARAYDAIVERDSGTERPHGTARAAADSETQRASRLYGTDMAEYGCGFGPDEGQ